MKKFVITIGREYESGGKQIGEAIAKRLGIEFYDAPLLRDKAKEVGIEDGIFDLFDEKPTRSFLFSVVMDPYAIDSSVNSGKVIEAQRKVITWAMEEGSCVIVGRRADKILADNPNLVSIFIGADMEDRINTYLQDDGKGTDMNQRSIRRLIERKDKERASYYNYFDDGGWGKADNYTMCFSTSKISADKIVDIVCDYIENTFAD